jgi:hypothetical protein
MKKRYLALAAIGTVAVISTLMLGTQSCTTVPDVTGTNFVTYIDPVKLAQVEAAIQPAASSVLRRAILNSPQHADEIAGYARAVGSVFCQTANTGQFSPSQVLAAADRATAGLQTSMPPEAIDGKNAALALYTILWNDKLTTNVPTNGWPYAVCNVFCRSIDQALKDAGKPGVQ